MIIRYYQRLLEGDVVFNILTLTKFLLGLFLKYMISNKQKQLFFSI